MNSFDEFYEDISSSSDAVEEDRVNIIVIILLSVIIISIIGLITTITLLVGVSRRASFLFLPWLVWHMLEILGCVASGEDLFINNFFATLTPPLVKLIRKVSYS